MQKNKSVDIVQQKITDLKEKLNRYSYEYYVLDQPTIDDISFDNLLKELETLEKQHPEYISEDSPTQRVGGQINKDFKQVVHRFPMLSLSNTYSKEEIIDFVQRAEQALEKKSLEWVCELKYDGLAISLLYENGLLKRAVTRGNGIIGDDVTANIRTIRSIPLRLQGEGYPQEFEIRGEVIFPHKAFEEFNKKRVENGEEPFANCRNAASGSLKLQDPKQVAQRKLDCFLYFLMSDEIKEDTHYKRILKAREWGFKTGNFFKLAHNINEITEFINYWDKERFNLPFDIDGIVIKLNEVKYWNTLGTTAKSPKWATAYKFKAEQAFSKLQNVEYQVGRTGVVTPVAEFEPVHLGGTVVKRATLHNADQMEILGLCKGDILVIEKAGEIIPKIVEAKHNHIVGDEIEEKRIHFVSNCPVCGALLVKEEDQAGWFCPNYNHCPPQILGRFQHFISKKAMDIDTLGGEKMRYLLNNGKVSDFASLYDLKQEDVMGVYFSNEGKKVSIKEKSAKNIINAIKQSKQVPFERVLYALGIRYVGEVGAQTIAQYFENIDNLQKASMEELLNVEDVGQTIAQSVYSWFQSKENLTQIEKLRQRGLQFHMLKREKNNTLQGKTFVVSGSFQSFSRDGIKKAIEENGGKNTSSLSSKTDYLICGEKMGPEKKRKAENLNITMITEQEFINMLQQ